MNDGDGAEMYIDLHVVAGLKRERCSALAVGSSVVVGRRITNVQGRYAW
jgi:hypothetical protein